MPLELNGVEEALRRTVQDLESKIRELEEQLAQGGSNEELEALKAKEAEKLEKLERALEALSDSPESSTKEPEGDEEPEGKVTEGATEGDGDDPQDEPAGDEPTGEDKFEEERQQLLERIAELEAENHQFRASVIADLRVRLGYVEEEAREAELAKLVERTKESLSDTYADLIGEVGGRLNGERRHPGKVTNPALADDDPEPRAKESDGDKKVIRSLLAGKAPW